MRRKTKAQRQAEEARLNDEFFDNILEDHLRNPILQSGHMVWKERNTGQFYFESEWPEITFDKIQQHFQGCYFPYRVPEVELAFSKCVGKKILPGLPPRDEHIVDLVYYTPLSKQLKQWRTYGWEKVELIVPNPELAMATADFLINLYEIPESVICLDQHPTNYLNTDIRQNTVVYYTLHEKGLPCYLKDIAERKAVLISILISDKLPYKRAGWKQAKISELFLKRMETFCQFTKHFYLPGNASIIDSLIPFKHDVVGLDDSIYYIKPYHIDELWEKVKDCYDSIEQFKGELCFRFWTCKKDMWESPDHLLIG